MHWLLGVLINAVLFWVHCVEALVIRWVPLKYRAKNISGEVALVTGAGGGIGRLISLGLAMQGCQVVCWDIAKQANEETARLIRTARGVAHTFQVDLTDKEDIYRTARLVKEQVGKVNILVNNAGVVTGKTLLECTDEQIKRTFDVNILAHFWTVKSFLPEMLKTDKGHIVNVASLAGMNGINRLVDYCSSKFAAVGFDESLRTELQFEGHHGIKTTVICPFFVKTPLFDGIDSKIMPVLEPEYVAEQTIKAILTEEHVVILPRYAVILMMLKSFTPVKAMNRLVDLMGMADTMKAFQGPKTKYL